MLQTAVSSVNIPLKEKKLAYERRDLSVLLTASFFCSNLVFWWPPRPLWQSCLWKTKMSTCEKLGSVYSSDKNGKQLYEKILDCKMLVSSHATYSLLAFIFEYGDESAFPNLQIAL